MVQEVVVVAQFQVLGIGEFQQVRNIHAAGWVVDHGAVPGQPCNIVRIGETVGKGGFPGLFVDRVRVFQEERNDVPVFRNGILEIIDHKVFIVAGNILVAAGRADGFHGGVQEAAEFFVRQFFHRQHQVQIFLIGNIFFRGNVKEDTDNAQILNAGFYLY